MKKEPSAGFSSTIFVINYGLDEGEVVAYATRLDEWTILSGHPTSVALSAGKNAGAMTVSWQVTDGIVRTPVNADAFAPDKVRDWSIAFALSQQTLYVEEAFSRTPPFFLSKIRDFQPQRYRIVFELSSPNLSNFADFLDFYAYFHALADKESPFWNEEEHRARWFNPLDGVKVAPGMYLPLGASIGNSLFPGVTYVETELITGEYQGILHLMNDPAMDISGGCLERIYTSPDAPVFPKATTGSISEATRI